MAAGMLFDQCFSAAGKATDQQLEGLRQSLGSGVDPAVDYNARSQQAQLDKTKALAQKLEEEKQAVSPVDDLKTALKRINQVGNGGNNGRRGRRASNDYLDAAELMQRKRDLQAQRNARELGRPSSAFMARSRNQREHLLRNREGGGPGVGAYQVNLDVCRPKTVGAVDIGGKDPHYGRKQALEDADVLGATAELRPSKVATPNMSRCTARPDFLKSMVGTVNEPEVPCTGDIYATQDRKTPCFDFARLISRAKRNPPPDSKSEPGDCPNVDPLRPRSGRAVLSFAKQSCRRPDSAPAGIGARLKTATSCKAMDRRIQAVNMKKQTARPSSAPCVDQGWQPADPEADAALRARSRGADNFDTSLTREQHFKISRAGGSDTFLLKMKENLERGPASTEWMTDVDERPCLRRRVQSCDFGNMAGRARRPLRGKEAPSRRRPRPGMAKFDRGQQLGESKTVVKGLSHLSGCISELRASRKYEAMEVPAELLRDSAN
eukprot:TRINITY_DN41982_c0_g1_i2.p1 TRINITY_DN41982_c0_g1~~TRINITY_DN41982_c0_g1_i2.p1  ORF type:complete len:493 (+),score=101.97 TRINITY_DN41982_c0_g1_i2:122-1600(+)